MSFCVTSGLLSMSVQIDALCWQRAVQDVLDRMRNSHATGLGWVFELDMIALMGNLVPSISLEPFYEFPAIHRLLYTLIHIRQVRISSGDDFR